MIHVKDARHAVTVLCIALAAAGLVRCGGSNEDHGESDRYAHMHTDDADRAPGGRERDTEHHEDENHEGDGELDHEPLLEMTEEEAERLDIEVIAAAPGSLGRTIDLLGEIVLNGDRVVHVVPRVGGIVRSVYKHLGDEVVEGEIMAVIESRELADATAEYLASRERLELARMVFQREEALWRKGISSEQEYLDAKQDAAEAGISERAARQKLLALGIAGEFLEGIPARTESNWTRYEIRATTSGTIIMKRISLGEVIREDTEVYVVADLDTVWVDINVYQNDLPFVSKGQPVSLAVAGDVLPIEGTIDYVGPVIGRETRTALARVILPNPENALRPGTFVTATVSVDEEYIPVAVPADAVQVLDGESIVFVWTGSGFETRPVVTGRSSGTTVEIVSGLEQGLRYAARGAFNLKAQLVTGSLDGHAGHGH
jgi:cobalt-zinc-cadmium efflux system membrane fusion protein